MNIQDWSVFWWSHITGAHLVVTKVVDALMENSNVIIDIPADLPWRQVMRSVIEDEFRRKTGFSDTIIEIIDAKDDVPDDMSPGAYLLQGYAPNKEVRNGYRSKMSVSIQDYIKKNGVLKNRIIWIKGLSEQRSAQWLEFCSAYQCESSESGMFVLEVQGDKQKKTFPDMHTVRLLNCISSYDVQLFNSFIVEERKGLTMEWKRYLATAAANICNTDSEISAYLLEHIAPDRQSPLDVIEELADLPQYVARGTDRYSAHIFAYCRSHDSKELEQRLWKAQIKTLFPLIEMERIQIITEYYEDLQDILDNHSVEQFGEIIRDPIRLELGTLCYLMCRHSCFHDKYTRDRIDFLHQCRNHLAHAHCCNVSEVKELLDGSIYKTQ